ncbi:putative histidine kinase [Methanocella paludicola SANAE]|uniref:histidine kinase n=1 Tax=Methanocella paludicola (strain DSM 17711 / JCM 13418 / NBRC 101707 / SANAE) TaxID=304371 RepID=D1YWK1_METPS|nr:PAS domain S-box protein [Methanocella paludicola]BAI60823.1 putative histidine kinase [Methanocella paludicola SANAE]
MASRSGSKKKYGSTRGENAGGRDGLIGERKPAEGTEVSSQAAKALQQGDGLYRQLVESSADFIYVINRDFRVGYLNRSGAVALGMSPEDATGKHLNELFPIDTAEKMIKALSWVFESGRPRSYVMTHHFFSGDFYIHVSLNPIFDSDGKVGSVVGVSRDINDLKKTEVALQESEERLRLCSATARFGTFDWNIVCDRHIWSPETYEIYGVPLGTPLTLGFIKSFIYPGDERDDVLSTGLDPAGFGEYTMEYRIRRAPNGEVRWVYVKSHVFFAGEGVERRAVRILGAIQDITERKQAEEALKDSEDKYRSIVEQSSDGILLVDGKGWILDMNRAEEMITGCTREDWIGRPLLDMLFHTMPGEKKTGETYAQTEAAMSVAYHTGFAPWIDRVMEIDILRPDGARRTIQMVTFPIRTSKGTIFGSIIRDITDRKTTEDKLKAAKAQSELYLDLMGHDINNLHQIALGYLELARGMPPGEEQARFLDTPVEVLQRSAQLIQNVRKLQKLHEGVVQAQDVDVCQVLVDIQREFGAIPHKPVTLNINGHGPCLVRANELLHDVFSNLVSNAVKHTGDKSNITVYLDVIQDNGTRYCRVAVEDDGPGIPDDFKATIFNRTLKGTKKAKGMGLGLYLVKSLVDSYCGRVWVEDRVQGDHMKGARFVVMLPSVIQ